MRFPLFWNVLLVGAMLITGCAGIKNPTKDWDAKRFYDEAQQAMADGKYDLAITRFEDLEARFPYGRYAQQAQLEIIYAYFKNTQGPLAIEAADRFIRLHPTHPHVAYAYYLKGLVNVPRRHGLAKYLNTGDDIQRRDPKSVEEAYLAFKEVVERFPDSHYARDASRRIAYLSNEIAKHEINVARFYLNEDAYVAAVNRSKFVLENFQSTPSVEDALGIQAMAYQRMGLTELMRGTVQVLELNFPNSEYFEDINAPEGKKKKRKKKKKKKKKKKEGSIINY
ncbi:MAG: outer membrane protein assembly factor BamD [Proteobacteria bacterium]|nr:MAG: outer membrane protein assembly factor BamD [Pseudomonadota bacterium]TDJ71878.1 MAG: outer membrane protein assembly factor BamD [Pseudomonadota bacterium]